MDDRRNMIFNLELLIFTNQLIATYKLGSQPDWLHTGSDRLKPRPGQGSSIELDSMHAEGGGGGRGDWD